MNSSNIPAARAAAARRRVAGEPSALAWDNTRSTQPPVARAAIASAVNDAIRPLGIVVNSLPIKIAQLGDMIAAARSKPESI